MILKRRGWWLLVALVPLIYLPLRAQETPPVPPAPAEAPAPVAPAAPASQAAEEEAPPAEALSADNSLSFPVDI